MPVLINDSQRECGTPLDTIPPCPPELTITNGCEDIGDTGSGDDIINNLVWINPMNRLVDICEETDDVVYYTSGGELVAIKNNFDSIPVDERVLKQIESETCETIRFAARILRCRGFSCVLVSLYL